MYTQYIVILLGIVLVGCQPRDPSNVETESGTSIPGSTTSTATKSAACTTLDNKPGECISFYLCKTDDEELITNNNNNRPADINLMIKNGPCISYMDTCCRADRILKNP